MATGYSLISALRRQKDTFFTLCNGVIPGDVSFTHSLSPSITSLSSLPPSLCVCQAAVGWGSVCDGWCLCWLLSLFLQSHVSAFSKPLYSDIISSSLYLQRFGNMCVWIKYTQFLVSHSISLHIHRGQNWLWQKNKSYSAVNSDIFTDWNVIQGFSQIVWKCNLY